MASPKYTDRILAGRVRGKILKEIERILDGDDEAYKKEIILRLAPTSLPRITEVTGEDGNAIVISVSKEGAEKYGIASSTSADIVGQSQV